MQNSQRGCFFETWCSNGKSVVIPMLDDEDDEHEAWPNSDSKDNTDEYCQSDSWPHHTPLTQIHAKSSIQSVGFGLETEMPRRQNLKSWIWSSNEKSCLAFSLYNTRLKFRSRIVMRFTDLLDKRRTLNRSTSNIWIYGIYAISKSAARTDEQ